jgi:hypothetical protein
MKPWLLSAAVLAAGIIIGATVFSKPKYPTCDPKAEVCPACTKCTHCRICSKEGGSCSVCRKMK